MPDDTPRSSQRNEETRQQVARLYVQGASQAEIQQQTGLSLEALRGVIREILKRWCESNLIEFDTARARELAKIDHLEREAWRAWERSCSDAEVTKTSTDGEKRRAERTVKQQVGDPSFLGRVAWCIEKRCKLLGLDAAAEKAGTGNDRRNTTVAMRRARLLEIIDRLRDRRGTADD